MDHRKFLEDVRDVINEGVRVYEQILQHKKLKMNKRTPLEIQILIHYYVTGGEDYPNQDAPAVKDAIKEFIEKGLLERNPNHLKAPRYFGNHSALQPYIDALRAVPLPIQKWTV